MEQILPAIVGAVSGGIVSLLTNVIFYRMKRSDKKRDDQKTWYKEVNGVLQDLKMATIQTEGVEQLPTSEDSINEESEIYEINEYANQLKDLNSDPVPDGIDPDIRSSIREVVGRIRNPLGGSDDLQTTVDLSEYVYERCYMLQREIRQEVDDIN